MGRAKGKFVRSMEGGYGSPLEVDSVGFGDMKENFLTTVQQIERQMGTVSGAEKAVRLSGGVVADAARAIRQLSSAPTIAGRSVSNLSLGGALAEVKAANDSIGTALKAVNSFSFARDVGPNGIFRNHDAANAMNRLVRDADRFSHIRAATEEFFAPLVQAEKALRSICAFPHLQRICDDIKRFPPFGVGVTRLFRYELGDWRDNIQFPKAVFENPSIRTSFYFERGLRPSLTGYQKEAFEESLEIDGLSIAVGSDVHFTRLDGSDGDDDQETGFERNAKAYDQLQRFETKVRVFIEAQMTAVHGSTWVKRRVPEVMRKRWASRRDTAIMHGGATFPLIWYADFTDYVQIVVQGDNWREVFQRFFQTKESVRESFQRLYPVRIAAMHSRELTRYDMVYLNAETLRLLTAISRR
jgi:hypothetical protein